jgi:flagellar assembly protein FliH
MMGSSKPVAKSSPHSRFIPREEIDDVAAWHFSAIGGATEPAPLEMPTAPEPVESVDLEALQEAREQAFAEGYAQGHETGANEVREALSAAAKKQTDDLAERMTSVLKTMAEDLLDKEQDIAEQLLALACELARQVVRQEIKTTPHLLRPLIGEALEMIVEDGLPATVRMNPDDLARMHDSLVKTLGENSPEFVGDAQITQGGCVIHSPSTSVDVTVEKRWARAVGNLGLTVPWKSGDSHE